MINKIRKISSKLIESNKVYLYSAGFNVDKKIIGKERIYEELEDLKVLIKKKIKIILLSHQGSYKKKNTIHFSFLVNFLKKKLNTKIKYLKKKNLFSKKLSNKIKNGEILLMPNTRFYKGEEENSEILGKKYSKLADYIIIGGFSKAHRSNASNNSILKYKPAYLSNGIFKQIKKIEPWASPSKNSVCILGGEKEEKINIGLKKLCLVYDHVIPSGVVLNTILKSLKIEIGESKHHDMKEVKLAKKIYNKYKKKIYLPETFLVFNNKNTKKFIKKNIYQIKYNEKIAGFILTQKMKKILNICVKNKNKILVAGTPSLTKYKVYSPTREILKYLKKNKKHSLLLGGDTVSDIKYDGVKSSGGGSALYYLTNKMLPIIQSIYKNQRKFHVL